VWHTATMRSLHWPGLRQAPAALAATGCLILAACGGGGGGQHPSAKPTASTTMAALVQDGAQVAAFVEAQAKTSFGAAAAGSTATVTSVTVISPSQATVDYEVLLLGTPLLKNQVGTAVYLDGVWKVAIASFCGLAYLEYPKTSPKLPAICRS